MGVATPRRCTLVYDRRVPKATVRKDHTDDVWPSSFNVEPRSMTPSRSTPHPWS